MSGGGGGGGGGGGDVPPLRLLPHCLAPASAASKPTLRCMYLQPTTLPSTPNPRASKSRRGKEGH